MPSMLILPPVTADAVKSYATTGDLPAPYIGGVAFVEADPTTLYISDGATWQAISGGGGGGISALTGDVTASGSGSVAATVALVGGQSAANVAAATVLANAATASNTINTIVKRDGSGNFAAGTITAALTGTASGNPPNARTIATTSPLNGGGDLSANRTLTISQSSTSTDGYLSSTDWNTFNGKQAAGSYITSLTGDVTASGPGAATSTVASVGGSSASAVNSATVLANAATSANTVSAIVRRDASGDFSAGTITANLTGTASGNVPNSRTISTSAPLTGGGNLGSNLTLGIPVASNVADGYLSSTEHSTFSTSAALTGAATNLATPSTLVLRDSGGSALFNGMQAKSIYLQDATTNTLHILPASSTTTYAVTMPAAQGAGALTNDGSGNLSWSVSSVPNVTQGAAGLVESAGQLLGTDTNDTAASGYVGELISVFIDPTTPVDFTNGGLTDIGTITLSEGDWDVSVQLGITQNSGGPSSTAVQAALSPNSTSFSGTSKGLDNFVAPIVNTGLSDSFLAFPILPYQIANATTLTLYLVAQCATGGGIAAGYGRIVARRVR